MKPKSNFYTLITPPKWKIKTRSTKIQGVVKRRKDAVVERQNEEEEKADDRRKVQIT